MAFFEVQCRSESLDKQVRGSAVIPGNRQKDAGTLPVIRLLHGLTDESMRAAIRRAAK